MCEVCDETLLKEEIRAEMQAEIKALNQKLQDVQVDYAHLLQRNATADEELAQLQKDYEESLKESAEAQVNLQKQLSALEHELAEVKSEIATLQVSEQSFFNEELRLKREQDDVEKQVDLQQGEKLLMEQRRQAMVDSLNAAHKQLKDAVPLSQLEREACIQCKARIQALLRDRSPATTSAHSEESPD